MKRDDWLDLHKRFCDDARALSERKGHDYSGEEDTLRNLKSCETAGLCSTETGIMVRLSDKTNRLVTLLDVGEDGMQVKDESLKDTILDIVNYNILLYAVLVEKDMRRRAALIAKGAVHEE